MQGIGFAVSLSKHSRSRPQTYALLSRNNLAQDMGPLDVTIERHMKNRVLEVTCFLKHMSRADTPFQGSRVDCRSDRGKTYLAMVQR